MLAPVAATGPQEVQERQDEEKDDPPEEKHAVIRKHVGLDLNGAVDHA